MFVVEGIRHIGEAVEAKGGIEYFCYSPDMLTSEFAQTLLRKQAAQGIPCLAVDADTFNSLAEKENPQGILAVARMPRRGLDSLDRANFPWGVALASPQDPGNIGTILRTIDAVGASGLVLLDSSVDAYHPTAVRASMGAIFWYPVVHAGFKEFVQWARSHGFWLCGTSAHASADYREVRKYPVPMVLLLGSEREGLSKEQSSACDQLVRMPMMGRVTSLNLAVAAGVMLYSILERRDQVPTKAPERSAGSQR